VTGETASPLAACELHRLHTPKPLTVELHHVIPVAWQLHWQPAVAPYPGKDPDGRGLLWDARTVSCCPTGHRNVHAWIVKLMHAMAGEDIQTAIDAMTPPGRGSQFTTATLALYRYQQYGGRLQDLIAAREWGAA
jgi:hypothetical protein